MFYYYLLISQYCRRNLFLMEPLKFYENFQYYQLRFVKIIQINQNRHYRFVKLKRRNCFLKHP